MTTEQLYPFFQKHPVVTTDTRQITEGSIFFALKGETFDGNTFAERALELGAAFAVIDNPEYQKNERLLLVTDVLTALQDLARYHRRQFDIPFIAITGSNGKTTTKELVAAVMTKRYNTLFTKGNFNNHIGVPLTLLKVTEKHEAAIIEMGANHQGEIDLLCSIAEPTHGLITNIGKAHLEGFGGIEGVKKGKSEMYRWLAAHKGTLFINESEAFLKELAPKKSKIVLYSRLEDFARPPQYKARLEGVDPFLSLSFLNRTGKIVAVQTQIVGIYNFNNILTAIAVGKYFKVPSAKIKQAIADFLPEMNRSQVVKYGEATLILDAYNANPSSMRQALLNLAAMPQAQKVAIIGDMRELGAETVAEHAEILTLAQSLKFTQLITVGNDFGHTRASNTEGVLSTEKHFTTNVEAKEWFKSQTFSKDTCLLIKGSRGMKLEVLTQ
ncbi:MAG: UDP-N-acetylmuramoyl-tripeptide--D-alanyl-D-alanine ligase [Saprospiraceae bacterium]|nr:UDP-N-acetylmuramoyl-tripeptide--D-alanyl-D-alanine ligase [Saprospiraceae bacterium]